MRAQFSEADNLRVAEAQSLLGECLIAAGQSEAGRHMLQRAIATFEVKQPQRPQLAGWRDLLKTSR